MGKRKDRTPTEKLDVLDKFHDLKKQSPRIGLREAADQLGVSKSMLGKLVKKEEELRREASEDEQGPAQKRNRYGKDKDIEAALLQFYHWAHDRNIPLNGPLLMEKAAKIAEVAGVNFTPTVGWFARWKKRNGLVFATLRGEAAEADTSRADDFLKKDWPDLLKQFQPKDVFNTDETAIYFRALPDSTYLTQKSKKSAKGFKTAKDRITALVTCSLEGEKLPLLVIGKSKQPRCLKGKNIPSGVHYAFGKNAWMTSGLWENFLRELDLEMGRQKRKILLLADNCSAHTRVEGLRNITLRFLPPNTTSVLQPCDQGIIRSLKAFFRTAIRREILQIIQDLVEDDETGMRLAHNVVKKIDVLQAMEMLSTSWKKVKSETIVNCWRKGGFVTTEEEVAENEVAIPIPEDVTEDRIESFLEWVSIDDDAEVAEEATLEEVTSELAEAVADAKKVPDEQEEESEEEDEEVEPPVSSKEMRAALAVLETGHRQQGFDVENFDTVIKNFRGALREKFPPKQSKLSMFFQ